MALRIKFFQSRDIFSFIEPFRPIVDGVIFKDQALNLFRDGLWQSHKELIIGTAIQETQFVVSIFDFLGRGFPLPLFEVWM